jgi:hypothetical protein
MTNYMNTTDLGLLKAFPEIKKSVQSARLLTASMNKADATQFGRAVELSKHVRETVDALRGKAWNVIKDAHPDLEWKPFLESLFSLTYSYIARLQRLAKIDPPILSNYLEICKSEGKVPNILGAIAFFENGATDGDGDDKKDVTHKPLTVSFHGKKASISTNGTFKTDMTPKELKALIALLQSQLV